MVFSVCVSNCCKLVLLLRCHCPRGGALLSFVCATCCYTCRGTDHKEQLHQHACLLHQRDTFTSNTMSDRPPRPE